MPLLPLNAVALSDERVHARALAHKLTVDAAEQRTFLQDLHSLDLQAAPGCGKTTLIGLKLCLLASGWHSDVVGVCVLSHTNVAKDQIVSILQSDPDGRRFLQYPHFVGTIQGFVDAFLAKPYLLSSGQDLRAIDDSFYKRTALSEVQRGAYPQLAGLINPPHPRDDVRALVETSHFVWSDSTLMVYGYHNGNRKPFPTKPDAPSATQFRNLKKSICSRGLFTYADMYALASKYLTEHPTLLVALRRRFPFVMLDEMQDTSLDQEQFLSWIFAGDQCILQRIGDENQRIYSDTNDFEVAAAKFPRPDHLSLPRSMRFGSTIAKASSPLTLSAPQDLIGNDDRPAIPPRLIVFDEGSIGMVLPQFAKDVLTTVSPEERATYPVKAIGARKQSKAKEFPKMIGCYWPDYNPEQGRTKKPAKCIEAIAAIQARPSSTWKDRTDVLWNACCELLIHWEHKLYNRRPTPNGLRAALAHGDRHFGLRVRRAVLELCSLDLIDETAWNAAMTRLHQALADALALGNVPSAVKIYCEFVKSLVVANKDPSICEQAELTDGDQTLTIDLATIHSAKGETHAATLVLECFNGVHDLKEVLPLIVGKHNQKRLEKTASIKPAVRCIFVAMTRPRCLLAVAVYKDHVANLLTEFKDAGWEIQDLSGK